MILKKLFRGLLELIIVLGCLSSIVFLLYAGYISINYILQVISTSVNTDFRILWISIMAAIIYTFISLINGFGKEYSKSLDNLNEIWRKKKNVR